MSDVVEQAVEAEIDAAADIIEAMNSEVDPLNTPELNMAARDFQRGVIRVKNLANNINRNALAKIFTAVVEFPLGDKYPKFKNGSKEEELFFVALHALGAKSVMQKAIMSLPNIQEELHDAVVEGVTEEILKENEDVLEKLGNG